MFTWLRKRRRRKILESPFPVSWRDILLEVVTHYKYLDALEQKQLEDLLQIFIAEKEFEGCGGLLITDEIKVVIAAQACLLALGLPPFQYKALSSVLVYPTTVKLPQSRPGVFTAEPEIVPSQQFILGQAWKRGPVILVWDAVVRGAKHPESGHNVVYHEFAHILDMRDGTADGTPVLHSTKLFRQWIEVCSREFFKLKELAERGKKSLLDNYGAIHEAEFFAVATELFFDRPVKMQKQHPELYQLLCDYYRQDTAAREIRYKSDRA